MKPRAFYNDNDPKVCAWVRELMADGLIMEGDVDERSIKEIQPEELRRYTRIHLFCGIAGWDLALQLAGWPADRIVLTCSCPCQPFSCAGAGKGHADERHLWPEVLRLIRVLKPPVIFGEQVPAAIKHGWLDGVFDGLEDCGYACGALDLPACSVGAPHIRQRLYWMANSSSFRCDEQRRTNGAKVQGQCAQREGQQPEPKHAGKLSGRFEGLCGNGGLADSNGGDSCAEREQRSGGLMQQPQDEATGGLVQPNGAGREPREQAAAPARHGSSVEPAGGDGGVGDTQRAEGARFRPVGAEMEPEQETGRSGHANPWSDFELIGCADGKARRIESGSAPLVAGIPERVVQSRADRFRQDHAAKEGPRAADEETIAVIVSTFPENNGIGRVMRLRGYGNSLCVPVAAQFIRAVMDL